MTKSLEPFTELNENAKAREARDLAPNDIARPMRRHEAFPRTGGKILHRKRKSLPAWVDVCYYRVHFLVLLQQLFRMLELLRPSDVRDVNQSIDAFFKLDERSKVGKISDLAVDLCSDRVPDRDGVPGIVLQLLHAEADAFFLRVDTEHLDFDLVAFVKLAFRIRTAFRPRDLRNVNQSFNTGLELNEDPIFGDRRNFSSDLRIDRVNFNDGGPGIGLELLVSERNFFFLAIELEHLYLKMFANFK